MIEELKELSDNYNYWYGRKIDLELSLKQIEADLYFTYKAKSVGEKITQREIDYLIKTDPKYTSIQAMLGDTDKEYLKAKVAFNNKNTEISLKQSELKRELLIQRSN